MRTLTYIGRRPVVLVPQPFLISIITFTLVRMLPGDPARLELGPLDPEEGVELLRHQLRLDKHCRTNTSPTSSVFFRVTSAGPGSIRARLLKIFSSARQPRLSSSQPECSSCCWLWCRSLFSRRVHPAVGWGRRRGASVSAMA